MKPLIASLLCLGLMACEPRIERSRLGQCYEAGMESGQMDALKIKPSADLAKERKHVEEICSYNPSK